MTARTLLSTLLLAGCLTLPPRTEYYTIEGISVPVHYDSPNDPCPAESAACYVFATGEVFIRSPVKGYILKHELSHAVGMRHSEWQYYPVIRMSCAVVWAPGGGYNINDVLCLDGHSERVFNRNLLGVY